VSPVLNSHHKKVAYIAYSIAKEMNLPNSLIQDIALGSMLHDIGAFSIGERIKALSLKASEFEIKGHAFLGYELLKNFEPLSNAAGLIEYHHNDYIKSNLKVPLGSYIINLADRVAILLDERREIMIQIPELVEKISLKSQKFHPDVFAAFTRLARREYFLIEASSPAFGEACLKAICFSKKIMDLEMLRNFAKLTAQIIDFRSRFTATHSSGVAAVALQLCTNYGASESECKQMEVAGFLHDLGKLAVPNNILEKNGKLDTEEFNVIKKHTYYTRFILSRIHGFEQIASWAAYHHERMDGNGYPFHIKEENFSKLARIMAVSDVLTALTEDRPYRIGMKKEATVELLITMAKTGGLDKNIVELVTDNFSLINDVRIQAQQKALNNYMVFRNER
jgi:HD-GYP domain-containing protein (c-di-GMP phosphodiesterase class II)